MFNRLLNTYSPKKAAFLFVLSSVSIANIVTFVIVQFIEDPRFFVAYTVATMTSLLASLIVTYPSLKLYEQLVETKKQALENYRIDSLTGLYARKPFMDTFTKIVVENFNKLMEMSVMIIDLDHFKNINDSYGHLAGDAVMKKVGQLIRGSVREGDLIARFGGEEFVIVMIHINEMDVLKRAKLLCENLNNFIVYREARIEFSASIGCIYTRTIRLDVEELLRKADEQMYLAKTNGRNRFELQVLDY